MKSHTHASDVLASKYPTDNSLNNLGVFTGILSQDSCIPDSLWEECGYSLHDRTQQVWLDSVHPDERNLLEYSWNEFVSGKSSVFDQTYRFATKNGKWIWNRTRCTMAHYSERPDQFIGINTDITHIKATERELNRAKDYADKRASESETLRKVVAVITGSLKVTETVDVVFEQAGKLIDFDYAAVEILSSEGIELSGAFGYKDDMRSLLPVSLHPDNSNPASCIVSAKKGMLLQDISTVYPNYPLIRIGESGMISWIGVPLIVKDRVIGVLSIGSRAIDIYKGRDLSLLQALGDHVAIALENARLHEKIYKLAMIDPLMGIGSRHNFNHQAPLIFSQAVRHQRDLALVLIDVDHFKKINDTYGHDTGDIVLRHIAGACKSVLRESDLIARYGGEEIIVVLPETAVEASLLVAERIRQAVMNLCLDRIEWQITVSIGVFSRIPGRKETLDYYIHCADEALYRAKENGRNMVQTCDTEV